MDAKIKLYKKNNYTIQKCVNIEDSLYTQLKKLINEKYDATISDLINVAIENCIENNDVKYYPKPKGEILIYRSIMIRKQNVEALQKINSETGISVSRLINYSIKKFLEKEES